MNAIAPPGRLAGRDELALDGVLTPGAVALLSYAAVAQGAFYRPQAAWLVAGTVGLALTALGRVGETARRSIPFAVLGAALGASGWAAGWGPNAAMEGASLAVAAATVPVVTRIVARGDRARLLQSVSHLGAALAVLGLVGIAIHRSPWAMPAQSLWRNSSTLTYANAAGAFYLLALGASIVLLRERPTAGRRLAAAAILAGLATSMSRGAFVGAIAGLVVLGFTRRIDVVGVLARPAVSALVATAGLVPSIAGERPRPLLAATGLVAAAAVAAGSAKFGVRGRAVVLVALIAGAIALAATPSVGRVIERRALPTSETRLRTWSNTWTIALERPVFGAGPGSFSLVEEDPRGGLVLTRFVHNEYLQVFYESGLAGVAAVAFALAWFVRWVVRSKRDDDAWAVGFAMCAAFAVHSAFDFIWHIPVLVALGFVWLAVAATPSEEGHHEAAS